MDKIFEFISKPISEYLKVKGIFLSETLILVILIALAIVVPFLFNKTHDFFSKNLITNRAKKNLHPFFNPKEIYHAQKLYIQQKFQNIAPSKEDELIYTHSSVAKQKLIDFFFKSFSKNSDKRFFIVLADSGMGKTTFSLNLFSKYNSLLRESFKRNKYKMSLIPLGYEDADIYIQKIKEENNHLETILILDALDEDKKAIINSNIRLNEIINLTKDFRFVILTCRTQFFNNESLEPNEINLPRLGTRKGFYNFEKLYLSPFTNDDVKRFINKKYGLLKYFSKEKKKALKIIYKSPYLMARPMLLDFIQDLAKAEKDFDYAFEIYESLIDSWLNREVLNVSLNKKFSYKNDLIKFSSELALVIYDKREQTGYTINLIEFENIARKNNLDLTFFEMKTRSLLNRNPSGAYKFSHKSILEYFLAKQLFKDSTFKKYFKEEGMDMTMDFYNELCFVSNNIPFVNSNNFKNQVKLIGNKRFNPKSKDSKNCLNVEKIEISNLNDEDLRSFRAYKNIKELTIVNSDLKSLEDLNCFQNLNSLKIIDSKVNNFNRISELKQLEQLTLKNLNLFDYQKNEINWKELIKLSFLDLSINSISSFDTLMDLKYLKHVNLSKNNISNIIIPKTLQYLNISNNQFKELILSDLKLEKLDVSKNELTFFTTNKMNSLVDINISGNKINKINFEENTSVKILNASNNPLGNEIKEIILYQNLEELNLNNCKIQSLSILKELNNLTKLNIIDTSISKIDLTDIPKNLKTMLISKIEIENNIYSKFKMEESGTKLTRIS